MRIDESEAHVPVSEKQQGSFVHSLLIARTDALATQAVRYIVVGALATVVDVLVLYLLTDIAHLMYLISAAISFLSGIAVSYLLSIKWVFASRTLGNKTAEFGIFALVGVIGLGLTELILYAGVEFIGLHYITAKLVSVVIVFAWNFGARRALLFRRKESHV